MFPIQGGKSAVNVQFCCQGRGVWFTAQYHIRTSQALLRENQVGIEKFWLLSKCQPHNGTARLLCAERGAKMSNLRLLHFSPFQQIIQDFHPHPHQDINHISNAVLAGVWTKCQPDKMPTRQDANRTFFCGWHFVRNVSICFDPLSESSGWFDEFWWQVIHARL